MSNPINEPLQVSTKEVQTLPADNTGINLIEYIPLYEKYFNCKDSKAAILYMQFQYLFILLKNTYPKSTEKHISPGAFLEITTREYKKHKNPLFVSANSVFNNFLDTEEKILNIFFALMHEMVRRNINLGDTQIYSCLRSFFNDVRSNDINLYLQLVFSQRQNVRRITLTKNALSMISLPVVIFFLQ